MIMTFSWLIDHVCYNVHTLERETEVWAPVSYRSARFACLPKLLILLDVDLPLSSCPSSVLPYTVRTRGPGILVVDVCTCGASQLTRSER